MKITITVDLIAIAVAVWLWLHSLWVGVVSGGHPFSHSAG